MMYKLPRELNKGDIFDGGKICLEIKIRRMSDAWVSIRYVSLGYKGDPEKSQTWITAMSTQSLMVEEPIYSDEGFYLNRGDGEKLYIPARFNKIILQDEEVL